MKTVKGLSRRDFDRKFGENEQCLKYLFDQKWCDGFFCIRCNHTEFRKGKKLMFRRCLKCGHEESPTANTLFHKVKFDLYKAFGMIYEIMTSKKGANTVWLAERYEVSQNTAWLFKRKVQYYLKSSKSNLLTGIVHVDEFEIGTPQKGEQGRSKSDNKSRIIIACEIIEGQKVGNAYAQVITDFSAKSLRQIFDNHINIDAKVVADGWRGYAPLKEIYKKLTQQLSQNGTNFPEIHIQIRNFKNWLRGMHSSCSKETLQDYIDEYFYRFNRRNHRKTIVDKLLKRFLMVKSPTYKEITTFAT
jgi:transcription elongation factor Elf1